MYRKIAEALRLEQQTGEEDRFDLRSTCRNNEGRTLAAFTIFQLITERNIMKDDCIESMVTSLLRTCA
jgi:hypothetical protein